MNMLRLRLRSLFFRHDVERELEEELRYHLEREMEEGVSSGRSGLEQRKEECRDARGLSLIENTMQDLRYALRQLRKSPVFFGTAVFVLTLGIAATVTVLAFVDAALIKPLPYADQSRLVGVYESTPTYPRSIVSYGNFLDWQRLNTVFTSIDAYAMNGSFTLTTASGAEQVAGTRVSSGFFRTLGVAPVLGRDFLPGEDANGAARTILISYSIWQKRFDGKRDILGHALNLNGAATTIVGVLPRDFHFAPYAGADFWGNLRSTDSCEQVRGCRNLSTIARLKDGVSIESAAAQMRGIVRQLAKQYPEDNGDTDNAILIPLRELIIGDVRPILLVSLSGAGLLLLIACVNVSTLLLARSDKRRREFAVRRALGASSARLFRQFATEGVVLAVVGCGLGLLFAQWGMRLVASVVPPEKMESMPFLNHLGLNSLTALFACAVSVIGAMLFAVIPVAPSSASKRVGSRLVVMEVAIAMVLLVGAGLLGKSLYLLLHVDVGFTADHLAQVQTSWRPGDYGSDRQLIALVHQMEMHILAVPGVKSVGFSTAPPIDSDWATGSFHSLGQPNHGETNEAYQRTISTGYFPTLQAQLIRGRTFREDEDASKPLVAVVNQTLADKYFHGENPVGKQIYFDWAPKRPMQIVGVVADVKEGPLQGTNMAAIYDPINQRPGAWPAILVRTLEPEAVVLPRIAAAIHQIDPFITVSGGQTMTERINESPSAYLHRSAAVIVGAFAAVAFLLSVVGLYGVIAYSVSQRTREIGLRMALGAEQSTVRRLILREAGWLSGVGVVFGLAGSLAAASLLRSLLFGVRAWDVPTLAAVAAVLGTAALLASYIPARRAAAVSPMEALRRE
jgi:predicted permease